MTSPPRIFGLLPVRRLDDAKGRLGPTLTADDRAALALTLLGRASAALFDGGVERVAVITRDERLGAFPPDDRLDVLLQESTGLNPAVREGQRWALAGGAAGLLIVLPDLPLISADDVRALLAADGELSGALAPDRHGTGSNALLLVPPDAIEPAFGEGSAQRHRAALTAAGLPLREVRRSGFSLDLDTPEDLARLSALGHDWRAYRGRRLLHSA